MYLDGYVVAGRVAPDQTSFTTGDNDLVGNTGTTGIRSAPGEAGPGGAVSRVWQRAFRSVERSSLVRACPAPSTSL